MSPTTKITGTGGDNADSGLWQLVYVSAASPGFGPSDLDDVLSAARKNNSRINVTGILLYVGAAFLQVLEGEIRQLDALFDRIQDDPRHTQSMLLLRAPIDHRSFGDWTMGYSQVTFGEIQQAAGVNDFFAHPESYADLDDEELAKVLEMFRSGSFRQKIS